MSDHQFNPNVEQWKAVPGFPGYEVSDHGRVRSPKILKPQIGNDYGHLKIILRRDGRSFKYWLHRLVLLVFKGPCPSGMECCHDDGKPANCRYDNLRWDTPQNNSLDKFLHGTVYSNSVLCRCETCHKIFQEPVSHSWRIYCCHACYIIAEQVWGTCAIPDCNKPVKPGGKSYCNAHYLRLMRYGHPLSTKRYDATQPTE
jgi:hypothetical protein